jgi:hypothetical protein
MHYHVIEKARRRLRHAGTVEDRAQFRQSMIARLHDDIEALGHQKEAIKTDFRKRLARWETRTVPEHAPVLANPTDVHDARLYRLTGWIALLSETGLAAWIFMRLGVSAWIGTLVALGITFTLHGVFLYVFEDEEGNGIPDQTLCCHSGNHRFCDRGGRRGARSIRDRQAGVHAAAALFLFLVDWNAVPDHFGRKLVHHCKSAGLCAAP